MNHKQGRARNQLRIISLEELVEKESLVRVIDAFVDMLDLREFDFKYYSLNREGRPPFHPATMMKLYLYGYQHSIRSCRKLEKACKTNLEVMWLINEQRPHYRTIAKFRKDNALAFKEVFRYFVALLKDWNLIEGKTVAIDSFKIRAQNSLKNNFNARKVQRHILYIDNKIAEYEAALDTEFTQETKTKLEHNKKKKTRYQTIDSDLKATGDGQISTTDPDARAVVFQRNSVKVGYNIQAVSDTKHKLLIAADTGDVNDTKALAVMVGKVQENIGEQEHGTQRDILADKGYHSGRELKKCEELGVITYISPKESSSSNKNPGFAMHDFVYNTEEDTYRCPAKQILRTNGRWYNKKLNNGRQSYKVKHYKTKACLGCSLRSLCTKNKNGRFIERTQYQEYVDRNNERVNQNPDYYRQRQQIIEHQFGTLKRQWHFDYCLTRTKEKVLAEVYLAFTCYNLKRALSILGFREIMAKIKYILGWFKLNNKSYGDLKELVIRFNKYRFHHNHNHKINLYIFE